MYALYFEKNGPTFCQFVIPPFEKNSFHSFLNWVNLDRILPNFVLSPKTKPKYSTYILLITLKDIPSLLSVTE